jgi:hypothetical protein
VSWYHDKAEHTALKNGIAPFIEWLEEEDDDDEEESDEE